MMRAAATALLAAAFAGWAAGAWAWMPPEPRPKPYTFADRPLYDAWRAENGDAGAVAALERFLVAEGVDGVVETWELVRPASDWHACRGAPAVEVPPQDLWPNIVPTLAFVRDHVKPAIGDVEVVSAFRNAHLNACVGGAPRSAHRLYYALDLAPRDPVTREALIARICALQEAHGAAYNLGLGFYAETRFHIDSLKLRRWGPGNTSATSPCGPLRAARSE